MNILAALAMVAIVTLSPGVTLSQVLLPDDIKITVPESSVSQDRADYTGKWTGYWGGVLEHILVVEDINQEGASVIYAVGSAPRWDVKPQFRRGKAMFVENTLVLHSPDGTVVTYKMMKNGKIDGTYENKSRGEYSRGNFKRLLP